MSIRGLEPALRELIPFLFHFPLFPLRFFPIFFGQGGGEREGGGGGGGGEKGEKCHLT